MLLVAGLDRELEVSGFGHVVPLRHPDVFAGRGRRVTSWLLLAAVWAMLAWLAGVTASYYVPPEMLLVRLSPEQIRLAVMVLVAAAPVVVVPLYLVARAKVPRVHRFARHWLLGKRAWLTFGLLMHIGIDLGMALLAIENNRSGQLWKLLESHPAVQRAYAAAGFVTTTESGARVLSLR